MVYAPYDLCFESGLRLSIQRKYLVQRNWLPSIGVCGSIRLRRPNIQRVVGTILLHSRIYERHIHVMFQIVRNYRVPVHHSTSLMYYFINGFFNTKQKVVPSIARQMPMATVHESESGVFKDRKFISHQRKGSERFWRRTGASDMYSNN